jgi:hypothetical protein
MAACGAAQPVTVVRGADDVQVMQPQDVSALRLPPLTTVTSIMVPSTTVGSGSAAATTTPTTTPTSGAAGAIVSTAPVETIPLNEDDRPPELRLFEAFGKFRGCLEDKGYGIEGDLTDPNNPAYQDPGYGEAVSTCAARTDIVTILQEVQATRANLTPEEVEARNVVFTELRTCLEAAGWTIETTTSEIGLLEPAVFQNADGVLDERDINQCLSEQNLGG